MKESYLQQIQPTIQQLVMAISDVLKIDVEVADDQLFRISGTGYIKKNIWKTMSGEDTVFKSCLNTGEVIVVESPGHHPLCRSCSKFQNCIEKAEIVAPIFLEKKVIGVIGLIAFTDKQKEQLLTELDKKLSFLKRMADIITIKISEQQSLKRQLVAEEKISALVNFLDTGIIMFNEQHQDEFVNIKGREELELDSNQKLPKELANQMLSYISSEKSGGIIQIRINDIIKKFHIRSQPLKSQNKTIGKVITLSSPYLISPQLEISGKIEDRAALLGNSEVMHQIKVMLNQLSKQFFPLLITGEDGTGKRQASKYLHMQSLRKKENYLQINANTLDDFALHELLFGNENKIGALEKYDNGTLVIDDTEKISLKTQESLNEYLDTQQVTTKNGKIATKVQIVFISSANIETCMKKGKFHHGLFYKISPFQIQIPSLANRFDDILLLASDYLEKLNWSHQETSKKYFSSDVQQLLKKYPWPGNIQELNNAITVAYQLAETPKIDIDHFPKYIVEQLRKDKEDTNLLFALDEIEKRTIKEALAYIKERNGTKTEAAELLNISRATLFRKISEYNLD